MTILCTILAATVIIVILIAAWRERLHRQDREAHRVVVADLLDRVMARSYGEYVVAKDAPKRMPRSRAPLTDEEMAHLEAARSES